MPRDKYTFDLEDYFTFGKFEKCKTDEERKSLLTVEDANIIHKELLACREDFVHAARNWFSLTKKSGETSTFDLWDGQMLVIEKLKDMQERGKPQFIVVIKSRQLGLSKLGCSLAAWKCMFRSGQNSLIVSEDEDKTKFLWNSYTLPIYRSLPWFLKPEAQSITVESGMILDTDPKKTTQVGLGSTIRIVAANTTGRIQGRHLNMFHGSEFTSWPAFNDIVERGIEQALYDDPDTIAILESTAKGSGTKTHSFWNKMSALGEEARWETVFLPFFMDRTHVLAPHKGWIISDREEKRKEAVAVNWVRCDNKNCQRYFNRTYGQKDYTDKPCRFCNSGTFKIFEISDAQLYWLYHRELNAEDERNIKQEQAISAEEAFVLFGDKVFSDAAIDYATHTAIVSEKKNPPLIGNIDRSLRFHGYSLNSDNHKCRIEACTQNHHKDDKYLKVWEMPIDGATYYIGADIGGGIGKDYSVIVVIRKNSRNQDMHVATYRDNVTSPYNMSEVINRIGRFYNNAQVAIEYNGVGQVAADALQNNLTYPCVYRRKVSGDFHKSSGNGYHFLTNVNTKPKLITTLDRWLKEELFVIRDMVLAQEMKTYIKVEGTKKTEAGKSQDETNFHDDYVMAAMIALYTAHQDDYDETEGLTPLEVDRTPENQAYKIECQRCDFKFGASDPKGIKQCPKCKSYNLIARRNFDIQLDAMTSQANINRYGQMPHIDGEYYANESLVDVYQHVMNFLQSGRLQNYH